METPFIVGTPMYTQSMTPLWHMTIWHCTLMRHGSIDFRSVAEWEIFYIQNSTRLHGVTFKSMVIDVLFIVKPSFSRIPHSKKKYFWLSLSQNLPMTKNILPWHIYLQMFSLWRWLPNFHFWNETCKTLVPPLIIIYCFKHCQTLMMPIPFYSDKETENCVEDHLYCNRQEQNSKWSVMHSDTGNSFLWRKFFSRYMFDIL
jgi:hypothetical protein